MHEGKIVNIQAVLGKQKFPQFLNILKRLLSKFHHFWSSFRPLLSFIIFSRAYTKPGAKQSFHMASNSRKSNVVSIWEPMLKPCLNKEQKILRARKECVIFSVSNK